MGTQGPIDLEISRNLGPQGPINLAPPRPRDTETNRTRELMTMKIGTQGPIDLEIPRNLGTQEPINLVPPRPRSTETNKPRKLRDPETQGHKHQTIKVP